MDARRLTQLEVHDGQRVIRFTGVCIGEADSRRPDATRWTELRIYKTEAGNYIVEKVARSTRPGETDWHTSQVSETAQGAVESLHQYDDDGVRYLTHIARTAAAQACATDPEFTSAFMVEEVA